MKIATLILAAGSSSRMGESKQLLALGNTTLLGKVIENVIQIPNNHVFCVLGANATTVKESIQNYSIATILNNDYEKGLSTSITCGIGVISKLAFDAVIIVLGDQPNVSSEYLKHLIEIGHKKKNHIITSNYHGRNGVPALFPKKYFKNLVELEGDNGASKLLNSNDFPIFTMKDDVDLFDVDTITDYNKLITKKL